METILLSHTMGVTGVRSPEGCVELAARTCYRSNDRYGSNPNFLPHLIQQRCHTGVLEHAHASFLISGVSRALTHQLVRHRIFSYCQESQRFVTYKTLPYVIPPSVTKNPDALSPYIAQMDSALMCYQTLLEHGVPKEDARYVFPNATETTIEVSGNFRAWLEFFKQRLDKPAQWEIKEAALSIWNELAKIAPTVFSRATLEATPKRDYSILD